MTFLYPSGHARPAPCAARLCHALKWDCCSAWLRCWRWHASGRCCLRANTSTRLPTSGALGHSCALDVLEQSAVCHRWPVGAWSHCAGCRTVCSMPHHVPWPPSSLQGCCARQWVRRCTTGSLRMRACCGTDWVWCSLFSGLLGLAAAARVSARGPVGGCRSCFAGGAAGGGVVGAQRQPVALGGGAAGRHAGGAGAGLCARRDGALPLHLGAVIALYALAKVFEGRITRCLRRRHRRFRATALSMCWPQVPPGRCCLHL